MHLKIPRILNIVHGGIVSVVQIVSSTELNSQDEDRAEVERVEADGPLTFGNSGSSHPDLVDDGKDGKDAERDDLDDESDEEDRFRRRVDARVVRRVQRASGALDAERDDVERDKDRRDPFAADRTPSSADKRNQTTETHCETKNGVSLVFFSFFFSLAGRRLTVMRRRHERRA